MADNKRLCAADRSLVGVALAERAARRQKDAAKCLQFSIAPRAASMLLQRAVAPAAHMLRFSARLYAADQENKQRGDPKSFERLHNRRFRQAAEDSRARGGAGEQTKRHTQISRQTTDKR